MDLVDGFDVDGDRHTSCNIQGSEMFFISGVSCRALTLSKSNGQGFLEWLSSRNRIVNLAFGRSTLLPKYHTYAFMHKV